MPVIYRISLECRICETVGLLVAGGVAGAIYWILTALGLGVIPTIIVMFVAGVAMLLAVDRICHQRYSPLAEPVPAPYHRSIPAAAPAPAQVATPATPAAPAATPAPVPGHAPGRRPATLDGPRDGRPDDLKAIRGIGPKLEALCHSLGVWHFDQIASWTPEEVAWVDAHLGEFRGRVARDDWIGQARTLAAGGAGSGTTAPGAPRT